jgi:large exoprotein involved in heme utilization and adhesion
VGSTAGPAGRLTISGIRPESTDAAQRVLLYNAQLSSGIDGGTPATPPGSITITADTVSLSGRTVFFANTFGEATAPAGNILFNVNTLRANVRPDGTLINGQRPSSINSSSQAWQAGRLTVSGLGSETTDAAKLIALNNIEFTTAVAGGTTTTIPATITMTADTLQVTNSTIKTDTLGPAPAGNITLNATNFLADQFTKITSNTSAAGPGGNISLAAGQSVSLSNGATISAGSIGPGNAGNITINAGAQFLSQNASVNTEATHASGGNIFIQATDAIRLVNSRLSTSVHGGPNTSGGNITLDPAVVTLQNSQVLAQAVQGQGGNISIVAGTFLADPTSVVSASSQFGLSGAVNIQSPLSNLSGSLATLPQRPLQAQPLLTQRCAAQGNGHLSSLVIAGRDALPVEPGGWLLSPIASMGSEVPAQDVQPVSGFSFAPEQSQMSAGRRPQQLGSTFQRGAYDQSTGCDS